MMHVKRILMLIAASAYKELMQKKRYFANTIMSIILFYVIFLALWGGYSLLSVGNSSINLGNSFSGILISYYAWTTMLSIFTSTGYIVQENRQYGTIETLSVNSTSLTFLVICESLVRILYYFVFSWVNILLFAFTTRTHLYINVGVVFYSIVFGMLSVLGLSLIAAGTSMLFRKMENILSIMQFVLLGGLFLPSSPVVDIIFPFHQAKILLESSFINGLKFIDITLAENMYLLLNMVLYVSLGVIIFNRCLRIAKIKGLLNFY